MKDLSWVIKKLCIVDGQVILHLLLPIICSLSFIFVILMN